MGLPLKGRRGRRGGAMICESGDLLDCAYHRILLRCSGEPFVVAYGGPIRIIISRALGPGLDAAWSFKLDHRGCCQSVKVCVLTGGEHDDILQKI